MLTCKRLYEKATESHTKAFVHPGLATFPAATSGMCDNTGEAIIDA